MATANRQYHSTVATADAALSKINALGQPVDPRSFALWFKYAAGDSGLLSAAINARLARNGTLAAEDIKELHDTHIAPGNLQDKADHIGARMVGEFDQLRTTVGTARHLTNQYSRELARAARQLGSSQDSGDIRTVVDSLMQVTRELVDRNAKLQTDLQAMSEEIAQLRRETADLRMQNQTDPLTGLGNRRFFLAALNRSIAACRAAKAPLTLMIADIDNFTSFNKDYSSVVGDRVLRFIATIIKEAITGRDVASRYNGDAFAIILPTISLAPAVRLAEQLRYAVAKCELVRHTTGEKARLTLSAGVATLDAGLSAQALIEATELCLHAAKRTKRNCVISEVDEKLFAALTRSPAPVVR